MVLEQDACSCSQGRLAQPSPVVSLQAQLPALLHALGVPRRTMAQQQRPGELVLLREITAQQGLVRSRCYVNGVATSLRVLREIGNALVDVNGQHAAQTVR